MAALITTLIDKVDNAEVVRDKIAEILLTEKAGQKALATTAGKDPRLWDLRVFTERANPWAEFADPPDDPLDAIPIVNVSFEQETFDRAGSNVIETQKAIGTFNIDCYALGMSQGDGGAGHLAGDEQAAIEAMRTVKLVRNILMAAHYIQLDIPTVVGSRFPSGIDTMRLDRSDPSAQHVAAARFALQVEYNEVSPQWVTDTLDTISLTIKRAGTGEVYLTATFPDP